MSDFIISLWTSPVRAGPVVLAVFSFAIVNGLRRWFQIQYMPTYFAVFPLSVLDADVARYAGTGWETPPDTAEGRRQLKRRFLGRAAIAGFISFVVIPLTLGLAAAFYMTTPELLVALAVLLVWQGYASYQSTIDNTRYTAKPVSTVRFFAVFYVFYLVSLVGFMHRGYVFTRPYVLDQQWAGLAGAVWDVLFTVIIAGSIITVLSGVMVHLVTEREIL